VAITRIDREKCIGCGTCTNSCTMDVIRRDFFPADAREISSCSSACPAKVNIRGYISLLNQERFDEAIRLIREELPIPAVTGHVCFHPCEEGCARKEVDKSVNINALERYVADYWLHEKVEPVQAIHEKKVAIVGSGPAGLAAAYSLVKAGYPVTVFEAEMLPGGMLRMGIPEYRLPREILDAQIEYIRALGVEFSTGTAFGKDVTVERLKADGYDAVLLAVGAQLSRRIDLEGSSFDGVLWGLDFLKDVRGEKEVRVGAHVVVIGGGNVAVDAALTALRLGATNVRIVCLESREEMPAHEEGIEMALAEGVNVSVCWGPKRIVGDNGKVTGIELLCCRSVFDEARAFAPCFDEGTTQTLRADMVILAVGESLDRTSLPNELKTTGDFISTDPFTLETNLPGLFAAGVAATGAGSVVEAVASGKRAAVSIDRFLQGTDLREGRGEETPVVKKPPREGIEIRHRQETALLPINERRGDFREIKTGFDRETAEQEQQRCMGCGSKAVITYFEDCMTCYTCEKDCPQEAIYVSPEHIRPGVSCWG
jgi:NADPH-dependent glutamate synthase beta subunit-like oxidoreductase